MGDCSTDKGGARQEGGVAVSFTADSFRVDEHTFGESRGGEWIRELRTFYYEAMDKLHCFTDKERRLLEKIRELFYLFSNLPPMTLSFNAGYEGQFRYHQFLGPLQHFQEQVSEINYVIIV